MILDPEFAPEFAPELDPALDLVLTREINAPREILYACWTTPEHLVNWFVPKPHKVVACELDVRPGGACNTTFEIEGNLMENKGVYLEVVPNEKLVFTDAYSVGWKPAPEPFMTAIVTFEDLGGGRTKVTYTLDGDPGRMLGILIRGPVEGKITDLLVNGRPAEFKARVEA